MFVPYFCVCFLCFCPGVQAGAAGDPRRKPSIGLAAVLLFEIALPSKRRAPGDND